MFFMDLSSSIFIAWYFKHCKTFWALPPPRWIRAWFCWHQSIIVIHRNWSPFWTMEHICSLGSISIGKNIVVLGIFPVSSCLFCSYGNCLPSSLTRLLSVPDSSVLSARPQHSQSRASATPLSNMWRTLQVSAESAAPCSPSSWRHEVFLLQDVRLGLCFKGRSGLALQTDRPLAGK